MTIICRLHILGNRPTKILATPLVDDRAAACRLGRRRAPTLVFHQLRLELLVYYRNAVMQLSSDVQPYNASVETERVAEVEGEKHELDGRVSERVCEDGDDESSSCCSWRGSNRRVVAARFGVLVERRSRFCERRSAIIVRA